MSVDDRAYSSIGVFPVRKIAEGRAMWDLYDLLIDIPDLPKDFYIPEFLKPKNPK
jgi:hypothetical protein